MAMWREWNNHACPPMTSATPIYMGLRTKRCRPLTTRIFVGAIGAGVPPPITPTKILVVKGLHRFVRNPMYIGVALVIGGQAWLFHSRHIAIYMICMLLVAHLFVLFYEEPTLHRRFGQEYD